MVKHFTSLACLGILALSCSSKSGSDSTDGAGGTCSGFGFAQPVGPAAAMPATAMPAMALAAMRVQAMAAAQPSRAA